MEHSLNKIRKPKKKKIGQLQYVFPTLVLFIPYTLKHTVKLVYVSVCLSQWTARCIARP